MSRNGLRARLKLAMQSRALNQAELASRVDATPAAVSQWLSGKKSPSTENIRQLSAALGVDPEWLQFNRGRGPAVDEAAERNDYLATTDWVFRLEPDDGGRDFGNPNVWSFVPDINTLVREAGQNVLDQSAGSRADIRFRIITLRGAELDSFLSALRWQDRLRPHLEASAMTGQKLGQVLDYGLKSLRERPELLLLRVEDSGTTGLTGEESEPGSFTALCRNNLDSRKSTPSSAGAFGLGKAVFWRSSLFSTVLFHSNLREKTDDGRHQGRLIGKADLAWHQVDDRRFAGPGWFGTLEKQPTSRAVSCWGNRTLAKDLYLDREDQPGTSILVVGFHDPSAEGFREAKDLAADIEQRLSENFWPAIASSKLEATVEVAHGQQLHSKIQVAAPVELRPYVDAVNKYRNGDLSNSINEEGDVVRRTVPLVVPERRGTNQPHPETTHNAVLLVRRATESDAGSHVSRTAFYRGREMVIKYVDHRNLCVGAVPFHAVVLCGEAAGSNAADLHAEQFLRAAEPPSHNEWRATPELKTAYSRGGATAIERLFSAVTTQLRSLVRPGSIDTSDGPSSLKQLFRLGMPDSTTSDPIRLTPISARIDPEGRWNVECGIRVRDTTQGWQLFPVLVFNAETGAGRAVKWSMLQGLSGCVVTEDRRLRIPPGTRQARFKGVSDPSSHPVSANESTVMIDLRHLEPFESDSVSAEE